MDITASAQASIPVMDNGANNQSEVITHSNEPVKVDQPNPSLLSPPTTDDSGAVTIDIDNKGSEEIGITGAEAPGCKIVTGSVKNTDEPTGESSETIEEVVKVAETDVAESGKQNNVETSSNLVDDNAETIDSSAIEGGELPNVGVNNELASQSGTLLPPELDRSSVSESSPAAANAETNNLTEVSATEKIDGLVVPPIPIDEDSCQSGAPSESNTSSQPKRTRVTSSKLMLQSLPQGVGADALFEYRWPLDDDHAEYWMLQEQVSVFLDIKSFRRKYPDLERRQIDIEERNYLTSCGVVTEMQCDLGLTALKSDDISDLMLQDYQDKYDEYAKVLHKKEHERLTRKHQEMHELQNSSAPVQAPVTKVDIKKLTERAVRSAAHYNSLLARDRREERKHYYDISTSIVQYPINRKRPLPPELTRPSTYPVAVLRGQYTDSYTRYTSEELKYLPVKTALYEPPLRIHNPYMPLPPQPEDMAQVCEAIQPTTNTSQPAPLSTNNKKYVTKLIDATCVLCGRGENKRGNAEKCIKCTECHRETHPTCCELTEQMLSVVLTYNWMCMECKVCVRCSDPGNEDKMIVCDHCDRGYHTFCVGLKSIPEESTWACPECTASA